ncbi:mesothelin-like protein [Columba livia]|uniref:Mesothelin-like protein n=1 Tax=Columba livia TaxID=8932 RepID=A0A2I0LTL3_COLLI|nr:mesothelin-like protein [Columba livia]
MAYIRVVRKKLDQAYPSGLPDEQLKLLGSLSRLYTPEEISRWWVTSSDTLSALLNPMYGKWGDAQVQQLIRRYLDLGGNLTGPLLQKIGGKNLCNLQEEDIKRISPEAIRTAGRLNISSCSQTKKDQLYQKAQEAFASQAGSPGVYLCQIGPYLGGAPVQDLKDLAEAGVTINITTFLALNPNELQKLSVMDVKNLLGENLPYLKDVENEPSVMRWVQRQSQRELDCVLGIGLQGGTVPSPHPLTSASVTPTATVPVPTTLPTVPTPIAITVTRLSTILATVKPNATSPSSVPPPAVTHGATTTSVVPNSVVTTHKTSTLLVSSNPPAPGDVNPPPQPTPSPHPNQKSIVSSTASTQKSIVSSTAETTTLDCVTGAPPASPSPSSTNTARSGSHLSPCLVSVLTVAVGTSLLRGLL